MLRVHSLLPARRRRTMPPLAASAPPTPATSRHFGPARCDPPLDDMRNATVDAPGADDAASAPLRQVAACRNCASPLGGPYCAACGQRELAHPDPTVRELLGDAAQTVLSVDGRLLTTLRALLFAPGRLTRDWLAGRRAPYASPMQSYLTASLVLFAVLAVQPPVPRPVEQTGRHGFRFFGGIVRIGYTLPDSTVARMRAAPRPSLRERVSLRLHSANALGPGAVQELEGKVSAALPQAVFVLVPVYGALLAAAYRGLRRRLPQHLVLALHVHAAAFTWLAIAFGLRWLIASGLETGAEVAGALGVARETIRAGLTPLEAPINRLVVGLLWLGSVAAVAQALVAQRWVYGLSWAATAWRAGLTLVVHAVALVLGMLGLISFALLRR